ncbi:MAG: hypothetical protein JST81_06740 [Bacteroidetes bacterium]|jgi:hypothetical protein|nr:hypothetical protein [Bacteroidota bacterium]
MGMEDDTRDFLVRIMNTVSLVFTWMAIQVVLGIYFELGFFDNSPNWKNYLYYVFFLLSLFFLLRYLKKKWKL